jgi:hypothetical protein
METIDKKELYIDIFNHIPKPTKSFSPKIKVVGYQSFVSFFKIPPKDSKFISMKLGFNLNNKLTRKMFKDNTEELGEYYGRNIRAFQAECETLKLLYRKPHFPLILSIDIPQRVIYTTYNGLPLKRKNQVPKNWKKQMSDICDTLESINIFHNDIRKRNILVQGKQLYLIDFGYAKKKNSYPYLNIQKNQIVSSTGIFDLLNKVKIEGKKQTEMAIEKYEY